MRLPDEMMERLFEEIDAILSIHEIVEHQGNKWCERCLPSDRLPMPYSWQNCDMRDLREIRESIKSRLSNLNTHEGKVNVVLNAPAMVEALKDTRYIQAIKLLREACADAGATYDLKSCKDAVDAARGQMGLT